MDYINIAKNYNVICHIVQAGDGWCQANGEEKYIDTSYCTDTEIWVGIYENKDWETVSFFHELGHILSPPQENIWLQELNAWTIGLQEAAKYGYVINEPSIFNECIVPRLNTYFN
jgi:hypothetical protein